MEIDNDEIKMADKVENEFQRLQLLRKQSSHWLQTWMNEPVAIALSLEWWDWFKHVSSVLQLYIHNIDFEDNDDLSDEQVQEVQLVEEYLRECVSLRRTVESEHTKCMRWMKWGLRSQPKTTLPAKSKPYRIDNIRQVSVQFLKKFKIMIDKITLLLQDELQPNGPKVQIVDHLADMLEQL